MPADSALMEKLTALCKRRGFIFPGSEIYGGLGGFWDYGPPGVDCTLITDPKAGEASEGDLPRAR